MVREQSFSNTNWIDILHCVIKVHNSVGPGNEIKIYEDALEKEFKYLETSYKRCVDIFLVDYKGNEANHNINFIIDNRILLKLVSEDDNNNYEKYMYNYLQLTGTKSGLLINIKKKNIHEGIKRFKANASREMK